MEDLRFVLVRNSYPAFRILFRARKMSFANESFDNSHSPCDDSNKFSFSHTCAERLGASGFIFYHSQHR